MTLQTLVVLLIGGAYGWRLGVTTVIAYLATGAAGLPVFAGPDGGLAPLVGPTAGYLFGFVAAAFITGWLSESANTARLGDYVVRLTSGILELTDDVRIQVFIKDALRDVLAKVDLSQSLGAILEESFGHSQGL